MTKIEHRKRLGRAEKISARPFLWAKKINEKDRAKDFRKRYEKDSRKRLKRKRYRKKI
nr:MAG TPA: hypothetical protein [Caudoviricetes sp.]